MYKFPERLKELRESKGLSQIQLAKKLNNEVTNSAIAMWETNQRVPNLLAVITLAQFFNVSIDYLAGLVDFK